jgi:hypothetical protein
MSAPPPVLKDTYKRTTIANRARNTAANVFQHQLAKAANQATITTKATVLSVVH